MDRRHFLAIATTALTATPFARLLSRSYRPAADPAFEIIRGNVGYYTNRGGTIGVYLPGGRPEGGVIVDTQFPEAAEQLVELLRNKGELNQFALLANTHHHGDHTSGNTVFAPLAENHVSHVRAKQNLEANLAKYDKIGTVPLPRDTFDTAWSTNLPDGKETISMRHFGPAHTGGDAVIHFENANVAHLGDLIFNRRFPYIDPGAGGDILNWGKVLKKIRKTYDRNTIYIFGHAAEDYPVFGTAADLKALENYLKALHKYVRKEKKKGTSLEALQQQTVTIPGAPEWKAGERQRELNLRVMYGAL
ncbi:MAG: MBL fold metallo-hydrolase [Bacteroidota bacterium]